MRLVALNLLLWGEEWERVGNGRYGMTPGEIADRTSLTPAQVTAALAKMHTVKLVAERADGYMLTIDEWKQHALGPWMAAANGRVL